jgi:IS5 family transposase
MATDEFFRTRLDGMVDMRHPLAVLASRMPWSQIEAALAPAFAHKDRKGRTVEGADMFGPTLSLAGAGVSPAGRPRLPIRRMVSLLPQARLQRERRVCGRALERERGVAVFLRHGVLQPQAAV